MDDKLSARVYIRCNKFFLQQIKDYVASHKEFKNTSDLIRVSIAKQMNSKYQIPNRITQGNPNQI